MFVCVYRSIKYLFYQHTFRLTRDLCLTCTLPHAIHLYSFIFSLSIYVKMCTNKNINIYVTLSLMFLSCHGSKSMCVWVNLVEAEKKCPAYFTPKSNEKLYFAKPVWSWIKKLGCIYFAWITATLKLTWTKPDDDFVFQKDLSWSKENFVRQWKI